MCDYSLMAIPNRLAICGEELVTHRFQSGSLGLASPTERANQISAQSVFFSILKKLLISPVDDCCPAVCVPPGARLLVRDIPRNLQKKYGLPADTAEVVFTETSAAVGFRDAICLPNGKTVLLQQLNEGQRIRVLSLSTSESLEPMQDNAPLSEPLLTHS